MFEEFFEPLWCLLLHAVVWRTEFGVTPVSKEVTVPFISVEQVSRVYCRWVLSFREFWLQNQRETHMLFIYWAGLRWDLETFALCPQFIVIEFCMFVYVRDELDVFEGELESYVASMNQTGTLTPVLLQVKELINVTKGKTILHLCSCCLCRKQRGTCDLWQVHTYNDYCCWSWYYLCYNCSMPPSVDSKEKGVRTQAILLEPIWGWIEHALIIF